MLDFLKLPLSFDERQLLSDVMRVHPGEWTPHFNTEYYEGDWSGVALLSAGGSESKIYTPDTAETLAETPVLLRCRYFRHVLDNFECRIKSARLLRLGPGSAVLEHCDYNLSIVDGTARVHIPVCTNPALDFRVNGQRLVMKEGEAWYINFNLPHRLRNSGTTERIHLVLDCEVNEWFAGFFPPEELVQPDANALIEFVDEDGLKVVKSAFREFQQIVLKDIAMQKRLRDTEGLPEFCAAVVDIASDRGYYFTKSDVRDLLRESRREWNGKWR
jgi:mannose-6-phosphate isomerase-like protein (cupin superfamily)